MFPMDDRPPRRFNGVDGRRIPGRLEHSMTHEDEQHLDLLAIFHYVVGGMGVLFACAPLVHLTIGIAMLSGEGPFGEMPDEAEVPVEFPRFIGLMFAVIGGAMFVFGQLIAWMTIYSARQLQLRRNWTFSFVVACIQCMFLPIGTALGIFTILVLNRDTVKETYERGGRRTARADDEWVNPNRDRW